MSLKNRLEAFVRGWLPKEPSMSIDRIRVAETKVSKTKPWWRRPFWITTVIIGLMFIVSALIPLGSYHFRGEHNIFGILWNFMLPTGWFSLAVGFVLIFHERLKLKNRRLAAVMIAAGVLFFVLVCMQDVDYFISLWQGTSGNYDVERAGWFLLPFPFAVAIICSVEGLLLMLIQDKND